MTTRHGTILPGKKLNPWSRGMEEYLPDNADVIIVGESPDSYHVLTLDEYHSGESLPYPWYVHKDNIQLKGMSL